MHAIAVLAFRDGPKANDGEERLELIDARVRESERDRKRERECVYVCACVSVAETIN